MNPVDANPTWVVRLLRIASALLAGAAIVLWVTPVNASGRNLVPVGCGSPASPVLDPLSDYVCRDLVGGVKAMSVALVAAAALLLLVSEAVVPRHAYRGWVPGAAFAAVLAVPCIALAVAALFTTVAASGADGTLIRCGTPVSPATDAISTRICGQLPARAKALSLGVMGLCVLATVGAGYITSAIPRQQSPRSGRKQDDSSTTDLPSVPTRAPLGKDRP